MDLAGRLFGLVQSAARRGIAADGSRLAAVIHEREYYDRAMGSDNFLEDDFTAAVRSACALARIETLNAGIPVFYRDPKRGLDIMEKPNGRKYEICFLPGAPRDQTTKFCENWTKQQPDKCRS